MRFIYGPSFGESMTRNNIVSFKHFEFFSETLIQDLILLEKEIFDHPLSELELRDRLALNNQMLAIVAYFNEKPIAYKVGYSQSEKVFYSWIGGVSKSHRGQGLAKILISKQHSWALEKGFLYMRTSSRNRFREMMILNLKVGFNVVGTQMSAKNNELSVLFEKKL